MAWLRSATPLLLVLAAVVQKCLADALTWFTRAHQGISYSGASVALLSEVFKFPLLALGVAALVGPRAVAPAFKAAVTNEPFGLMWIGAFYAAQNLFYFTCLEHISAAGYQALSQSKLVFTASFMWMMMGKRFSSGQILALTLLMVGTAFTQLAELSNVSLAAGSNPWLGGALTILSALLAALANVFYERILKRTAQRDTWVTNLQLTTWIFIWVAIFKVFEAPGEAWSFGSLQGLISGFSPLVWGIVFLKTLNCIIVPAVLKYADNIMMGYAKPASIIITCSVTACMTRVLPAPTMLGGIVLVLASMILYGKS